MEGNYITAGELIILLVLFAGPVYVLAAFLLYGWLKRRGLTGSGRKLRAFGLLAGATVVALPLTVFAWWFSAYLPVTFATWVPAGWNVLDLAAYITPPAVVASLIAFVAAGGIARRWFGPPMA